MGFSLSRVILAVGLCLALNIQGSHAQDSIKTAVNAASPLAAQTVEPLVKKRFPPKYPMNAANKGIEGWVQVDFYVEPNGRVSSVSALDGAPVGVFEKVTEQALKRWRYKPALLNGQPVRQRRTLIMAFELEGTSVSRRFRTLLVEAQEAIDKGDLDSGRQHIESLAAAFSGSIQEIDALEAINGKYHIASKEYDRAIYHFERATRHVSQSRRTSPVPGLVRVLFELQMYRGQFSSALNTFEALKQSSALANEDPIHTMALEAKTLLDGQEPLAVQGLMLGSCFKCGEGVSIWTYPLTRSRFLIDQVEGKINTVNLACDYHEQEFDFEPDSSRTLAEDWGACDLQVKGSTDTTFRLVEH